MPRLKHIVKNCIKSALEKKSSSNMTFWLVNQDVFGTDCILYFVKWLLLRVMALSRG